MPLSRACKILVVEQPTSREPSSPILDKSIPFLDSIKYTLSCPPRTQYKCVGLGQAGLVPPHNSLLHLFYSNDNVQEKHAQRERCRHHHTNDGPRAQAQANHRLFHEDEAPTKQVCTVYLDLVARTGPQPSLVIFAKARYTARVLLQLLGMTDRVNNELCLWNVICAEQVREQTATASMEDSPHTRMSRYLANAASVT